MAVSQKPYLLRALYEWMADNDLVSYIVVAQPSAKGHISGVPDHLLAQDTLTLNISPGATRDLLISNESISFHARFAGKSHYVMIAVAAVVAIFDRDSQQGMSFAMEALPNSAAEKPEDMLPDNGGSKSGKTAHLKIIK